MGNDWFQRCIVMDDDDDFVASDPIMLLQKHICLRKSLYLVF